MKLAGVEVRAIGALSTAPGFAARHDNDITLRIVKRIQHGADVPTPVVTPDGRLAWGERTVAAHAVNQTTHCKCKVVHCSDEELETLRKLDTARMRRHGVRSGRLIMRLVALTEPEVLQTWEREGTPLTGTGRVRPVRAAAREVVAAIIEMTPRAMAALDSAMKHDHEPTRREPEPDWDLRCHDWQPAPGLLEDARSVRNALRAMDQRLRQDQRELAQLLHLVPEGQRLHAAVHRVAAYVRSVLPEHLCPYCKSTVPVRPTCLGCKGTGWVGEDAWQRAPKELREEYLVSHGGQLLDPLTMQPPYRVSHPRVQSAQFVGDLYEEEEEPPENDDEEEM